MQDDTLAGRSAQDEYNRRAAKDAINRARNRPFKIAVLVATPMVVYLLVRYGAHAALERFLDQLGSTTDAEPRPKTTIRPDLFNLAGLLCAVAATINVHRALFGRRQTTEAWAKGAVGERLTAATLARLPDTYVVLHDLPIPGSRANIDHVVIGPTGVFTVETKHYAHDVVIRGGSVRSGRFPLGKVVDQASRQAALVGGAVSGHAVVPLVAIQGAAIDVGWFGKPVVGGVKFSSNRRLLDNIRCQPVVLDKTQVAAVTQQIQNRFSRT